jgi:hypothetical protein
MRHRMPSPVRPFDLAPAHLVEAAKRLFSHLRRNPIAGPILLRALPSGQPTRLELGSARLPDGLTSDLLSD